VLEGAIRSSQRGTGDDRQGGQNFSELPATATASAPNASKSKPAKLVAVFVMDSNETELTIPFGKLRFDTFRVEVSRGEKCGSEESSKAPPATSRIPHHLESFTK
jgi:hypothetical protein